MKDAKGIDIHEALDEFRAQKEKLEEEIHSKKDLCNSLKKAQDELITKFHETKLQSEKQAQELSTKSEELLTLSQLHQDLKSSLEEKDLYVKHLNSAIEKLHYEYGEKLQKLEGENKDLALALDESTATSQSLKLKVDSSNTEIEDLKGIILLKDKKILEISDKSETTKVLMQRDEVICQLEENYRDIQDKLKWKNEQFQHLEEAHRRLQDNFKSSKAEWERERSFLIKEIESLQTRLDSETRKSDNLQTQMSICNQSFAREESTRKLLEVELSEFKSRYENISFECHEAKSTIEKLSDKRDEEVAKLRDSLTAKDSVAKEMGYKMAHLEQENRDLTASLKEFQESQISNYGNTGSLKKLQKKYNSLEQVHKKCGQKLKEKEDEWKSELEKVRKEVDEYVTKLKVQSEWVRQLQDELESCHFLFEVHNEEISSVVLVLESQFSEAYSKLKMQNNGNEEMVLHLAKQLEIKNNAFCEVNANLTKKCEEVASFDDMKQHQLYMQEELHTHKMMLAESSKKQILLEEQIRVLENSRKHDDDKNDSEALSKKCVELEKWKPFAESQNLQLEKKNQSLLRTVNEQNEKNADLQQQLVLLETENQRLLHKLNEHKEKNVDLQKQLVLLETENQGLLHRVNEQNVKVVDLQQQLEFLETLVTEKTGTIEEEKEKYIKIIEDKESNIKSVLQAIEERNQKIEELVDESKALETAKINALMISEEKQIENDFIRQSLQKLESEVSDLCEKLKVKDESWLQSTQRAEELEALLQVNKLETENLKEQFGDEKMRSENLVKKLELLETLVTEKTGTIEAQKQDIEEYIKIIEDKENNIKSVLQAIEERNQKMEELVEEIQDVESAKNNALIICEEKQIEIDAIRQSLQKLELAVSDLHEKLKVKDESSLQSTQRAEELEALLQVKKLETANLNEQFGYEKMRSENLEKKLELLETLVTEKTGIIEAQMQDKEEYIKIIEDKENNIKSVLQAIEERNQKMEELVEEIKDVESAKNNALIICEEKQIEIDAILQSLQKLELELSDLNEKLKVKDESLLQSTQRAEELEALLQVKKLETASLKEQFGDEKMRSENLVKKLELLETLVTEKTGTIEAQKEEKEKYIKIIEDKESNIKSVLQAIEERNQKIEELVDESKALETAKINALMITEEKQIENDVIRQSLQKLESEVSDLCEKLKVKDESWLQSTQRAEELEALLQVNKLETENLKEQFGDEKMSLTNLVKKLEVQNRDLNEDFEKLLSHNENFLSQMEITGKQIDEYSNDGELTEMLENILKNLDTKEDVVNVTFLPLQYGKSDTVDERLPLVDLNK